MKTNSTDNQTDFANDSFKNKKYPSMFTDSMNKIISEWSWENFPWQLKQYYKDKIE